MLSLRPSFPRPGSRLKPRPGWHWCWCYNSRKVCPIDPPADGIRGRIDWKYALALELTDPGFDASVLSAFRQRLITGHAELLLCETMVTRLREQRRLKANGRQRPDSPPVLAAMQTLNRLECVGAALRHALHVLATAAPGLAAILGPCGVVRSL
jgi:transposase